MNTHPASREFFLPRFAFLFLLLGNFFPGALAYAQEKPAPILLMISIDGLRPDYVTAADAHGAKVPNLRRFLKDGTYAEGVIGVVPTVTYPSHTTLVTGVWPAKHGIFANTTFDPLQKNHQGWYWYAEDIRVPTSRGTFRNSGVRARKMTRNSSGRYLLQGCWRKRRARSGRTAAGSIPP